MVAVVVSHIRTKSGLKKYANLQEVGVPRWFIAPIVDLGYEFIDTPLGFWHTMRLRITGVDSAVICFNPSIMMMLTFLIPDVRKIALYQWRPIGHYSWAKRLVLRCLLKNADVIVVYSYKHKRYLQRNFPGKQIKQIGLYTDTNYFSSGAMRGKSQALFDVAEPFIFAPGDHLRDHDTMIEFAERLGVKLVITTRDKQNFHYLQGLRSASVEVHFNVSFDQLRALYCKCLFVLILSDSRLVPTGITTLSEALSCSSHIIINRGNACSYPPGDQTPSIRLVSSKPSVDELMVAAEDVFASVNGGVDGRFSDRQYVDAKLSLQSHKAEWLEILAFK